MKPALLACLLAAAGPSYAASSKTIRIASGPKTEDALRRYIESDPTLRGRFIEAAERSETFLAEARDSDLRDAIADRSGPEEIKRQLAKASGAQRAGVIAQLPGMKAPAAPSCRTLSDCAVPDLAMDVADSSLLPDSVRRLVRPWMLLQQARGSSVEISTFETGDAVLSVKLKGLDAAPLTLNVAPRLLGGFKVWFDQPLVLASLYGRERDAALKR